MHFERKIRKKLLKLSQLRGKNAKFRATMLKLERKMRN